jgi:hypothetical protein
MQSIKQKICAQLWGEVSTRYVVKTTHLRDKKYPESVPTDFPLAPSTLQRIYECAKGNGGKSNGVASVTFDSILLLSEFLGFKITLNKN